jgi:RNA polymerase sigma-70 factor (ECF subfamily)
MAALTDLLSDNVILWADGGGKVRTSLLHPVRGRAAVIRASLRTRRLWPENAHFELQEVNGQIALVGRTDGRVWTVLAFDVEQGRIQTIRIIVNPDKLTRV